MKKTLIALAALAATASFAQSSVTIYGVLDAGLYNTKGGTVSTNQLISSGHTSSRLGFRGTEDLGGGLKANFGLEAGLNVDNGVLGGPSGATGATAVPVTGISGATGTGAAAASNQIFSRGAFVGLEGGFGKVNLGKISTHANSHILAYTPGTANLTSVSFRTAVTGMTGWVDNSAEYVTPSINGFTGRVLYTVGNTAATSTANEGITDANKKFGNGTEVGLSYANGPIAAGVYSASRNTTASASVKEKSEGFGASYDFGMAKVGLTYTSSDPDSTATGDKKSGYSLGVTVPVSSTTTLVGFYADAKNQNGTSADKKTKFMGLGADYALSKRTVAYALYVKADNNATASASLFAGAASGNAVGIPTPSAGQDATAFGVGIRHSF